MVHRVEWTEEKVGRFWDVISQHPGTDETYFGRMVGDSVLRHVRRAGIPLRGRILDFGCGPGHFMERLLHKRIGCEGVDFSADSVDAARERLEQLAGFGGVSQVAALPTHIESNSCDLIFLIETIEHLLERELRPTIDELHRLLRPGGYVIVTTPNDEDLAASEVMCPDCEAIFHRIQHLRSWTSRSLATIMEHHGFRTVRSRTAYFTQDTWASRLKSVAYRALRYKLPHLLFLGQKPPQ
jgi:SAM-dependent methyltransferase